MDGHTSRREDESSRPGRRRGRLSLLARSLAGRLVLVGLVFLAVPVLVYERFREADQQNQILLLRSAQQQGQLISRALAPELQRLDGSALTGLSDLLNRFADEHTRVRLLLRPSTAKGRTGEAFYYVASAPAVSTAMLDLERQRLIKQGVLVRLAASCAGDQPLAIPVPTEKGGLELLTSIAPVQTEMGCWAVVTSHTADAFGGTSRPYWKTPEVQAAALIYLAMAAIVMVLMLEIWRNLRRFGDLARNLVQSRGADPRGRGLTFTAHNTVPELAPVAEDFDRLVATLHNSAVNLRRAAEDNAHAFKTPIAIIRQAVEPLKRIVPAEDTRGRRALDMIETSVERLDGLVSFVRRMDETAADLLEPPRQRIDFSALLERVLLGYRGVLEERQVHLAPRVERGQVVRAGEDLLETIVENVIDNAISFSPPGGVLRVALRRVGKSVEFTIDDEGPGVEPSNLDKIFERYFSQRPGGSGGGQGGANLPVRAGEDGMAHYGIGLWVVRRNAEAIGGTVEARNRDEGGLSMLIRLPLAEG
ncbi:sensor histidine kinase [Indioceanicola profundi]|uniref:sensor histidine kinase n=1 Tax=Indioceanicola profundi TaxID=2220096 RepID=UPI000E6AC5F9|nr:HAMP domain-containing sensor histidine kinase [Indioceanicola profundi]